MTKTELGQLVNHLRPYKVSFLLLGYISQYYMRVLPSFRTRTLHNEPKMRSTIYILKTYGTTSHEYMIWDFKLIRDPLVSNYASTFNCTSAITMRNSSANDVPINTKLIDDSVVRIWFDPEDREEF